MQILFPKIHYHLAAITVWYLEMDEKPSEKPWHSELEVVLLEKPISANHYRHYYYGVGKNWNWIDRMVMPDEELENKINNAQTEIYILRSDGAEAGYCELVKTENFCEIQYFGLFDAFVGKGLGKSFLRWTIDKAWTYTGKQVRLNTCSLDHPQALAVYQKAGFKIVHTKTEERKVSV